MGKIPNGERQRFIAAATWCGRSLDWAQRTWEDWKEDPWKALERILLTEEARDGR